MASAANLPPDEFEKRVDQEAERFSANPFAKLLGPLAKNIRRTVAVFETKEAMLRTAISVVVHGASSKDPFGAGPFGYEKLDSGFRLTSALKQRDQTGVSACRTMRTAVDFSKPLA